MQRTCTATFLLVVLCATCNAQTTPRSRESFDRDWRFARFGDMADGSQRAEPQGLEQVHVDDSGWQRLNIPHDWAIAGPFRADLKNRTGKLPYAGIGWYRKHFRLPAEDRGKRIYVDFDGAMSHAQVWLNGQYLGEWPFGYSSFRMELTEALRFGGDNVLAVRLDNLANSSRWYPGGGIYRHTWLVKTAPVHVAHWGTYVTTPQVSESSAAVAVQTTVQNDSDEAVEIVVQQQIVDTKDTTKALIELAAAPVTLAGGEQRMVPLRMSLWHPRLWSIEDPHLYTLVTTIHVGDQVVDRYETPFGIRTIDFHPELGFLLNGQRVRLNGVCLHHDLGPLGAAVHRRAVERQLEILKDMGCNAIRTSHNPPTPEQLEFADRMGFVVFDEAFDCWAKGKTDNDYGTLFADWHEKDLRALVHRDRNHPCVVAWSSGNEVREQHKQGNNHAISRRLTEIFHREDPTRPVTAGCNSPSAFKNGFGDTFDLYGFNYKPHLYGEFKQRYPNRSAYSSESASCVSSRGEYFFPVSDNKAEGFFNFQVSSYDLYAPSWAMPPDREFKGQDDFPYIAGEFVWTGFDYLGEPTPYNNDKTNLLNFHNEADRKRMLALMESMGGKAPSRSSYFGILDLCGFKKDRFYSYQARWRPDLPMAHILPHWNWPERVGKVTPVHVYTSGDEAELFLNGKSLGRKRKRVMGEKQAVEKNLAMGKSASVSTQESKNNNRFWMGNDNRMDTRWCASSDDPNQWWQIDLGSVQSMKSCVIYWEKDSGRYAYQVRASLDKQNWQTIATAEYQGKNRYSLHTFDTTARYLRIQFTGLKSGVWASFYECHIFDTDKPQILDDNPMRNYYRLRWDDVVYEPGELKVVAYKGGKKWAEAQQTTTGAAAQLLMEADRTELQADGRDLSYVTVKVTDKQGGVVPRSHPQLSFSIEGPGEIIATGNGDATDHTAFTSKERKAYNGLCLVIVRTLRDRTGSIKLKVTSPGLEGSQLSISSQ